MSAQSVKRPNVSPAAQMKRGARIAGKYPTARDVLAGRGEPPPVDKPIASRRQEEFVRLWASGESIYSAAMKAGFNDGGSTCYALAKMPHILAAYQRERAKFEEASQMTRKRVIDGLLESIDIAKTLAEPSSMIAGWREIAKIVGYYSPVEIKQTITHEGQVQMKQLERLSDEELFAVIQQQAQTMAAQPAQLQAPEGEEHGDGDTPS